MTYFSELGLAEPVLRALGTKGYADPTPIQRQAIPALLEGRDLLGIAQTGTGKTAAFSLPSIHRLAANPKGRNPAACRMLVLSPTRELAAQIAENMRGYARYLNLSIQCVFGGMPVGKQARALVPGCDILVATPGRLLDLIDQRALTLRHVEIFVLDEADQMMDLGFIAPLKRIANLLPKERQSLFFSATMPKAIAELGKQFIHDPVRVEVTPQATTAERVEQYATQISQAEKQALLTLKLREGLADGSIDRALVFTRTKHGADRVVRFLTPAGIESAAIHGNKSQGQRTMAIQGFRSGAVRVLVATDIAARGIDIPGVSHVFNFELPNVPEQYVHRIGRTARAGADGVAMSFVAPDERAYLRDIERLTRVKLTPMPLPEDFTKEASRLPAPSRKGAAPAPAGRGERPVRGERFERRDRPERGERRERPMGEGRFEQRERPAREERFERRERPARDDRSEQRARPERGERFERRERPMRESYAEAGEGGRPQRHHQDGNRGPRKPAATHAHAVTPTGQDGTRGQKRRPAPGHDQNRGPHQGQRRDQNHGPRTDGGAGANRGHGGNRGESNRGGPNRGGGGGQRPGGKPRFRGQRQAGQGQG